MKSFYQCCIDSYNESRHVLSPLHSHWWQEPCCQLLCCRRKMGPRPFWCRCALQVHHKGFLCLILPRWPAQRSKSTRGLKEFFKFLISCLLFIVVNWLQGRWFCIDVKEEVKEAVNVHMFFFFFLEKIKKKCSQW